MSIRRRLIIGVTAGLVVVLLLSGLLTVTLVETRLIGEVDDDLRLRVDAIENTIDSLGMLELDFDDVRVGNDPPVSPATIDTSITVFGPNGEIIASVTDGTIEDPGPGPDLSEVVPSELVGVFETVSSTDDEIYYRVTALSAGGQGVVVLGTPLTDIERVGQAIATMSTFVGVVAALVVAGSAWLIIRRTLRPIDAMIETAEEIAAGDLTSRVEVTEPDSEVGHLGTALNTMLGQIQTGVDARVESEDRMRQFISDASHELRTPLTSIRGYAELHDRGMLDEDGTAQAFSRIGDEARRMGDLVEDLLTLARLDQTPELHLRETDLGTLVSEVVQDARVVEPGRPIEFEQSAAPLLANVDGDRMRQAVGNLLANARVHTDPDTSVRVTVGPVGNAVAITVADEGPGLTEEQAAQVFDRLYQARPDRTTTGSGLGLAIVQSVVAAHGGTATVRSVPDEGTVFTLTVPNRPV